jgi:hypothetical protein
MDTSLTGKVDGLQAGLAFTERYAQQAIHTFAKYFT